MSSCCEVVVHSLTWVLLNVLLQSFVHRSYSSSLAARQPTWINAWVIVVQTNDSS